MLSEIVTGEFKEDRAVVIRADAGLVREMGDAAARTDAVVEQRNALLGYLRRTYRVTPAALDFLRRNTDLAWILLGARAAIETSFGPVIVNLDVISDPEDEVAEPRLFGYIRSPWSLDDALLALRRFDEDWFLNHLHIASGRLNFDLEF